MLKFCSLDFYLEISFVVYIYYQRNLEMEGNKKLFIVLLVLVSAHCQVPDECSANDYYYDDNGTCISCAESTSTSTPYYDGGQCVSCPQPTTFWDSTRCACPSGAYQTTSGGCVTCASDQHWDGSACQTTTKVLSGYVEYNGDYDTKYGNKDQDGKRLYRLYVRNLMADFIGGRYRQNPHLIFIRDVRRNSIIVDYQITGDEELAATQEKLYDLQTFDGEEVIIVNGQVQDAETTETTRSGISTGAIVGITVGSVVVLAIILVLVKIDTGKKIQQGKKRTEYEGSDKEFVDNYEQM